MRIHRVTACGFGPFKGTETVDFDEFGDEGIFLITGRTGSGKTSILDAVAFALYGSVPRYEGQAQERVRSDHLGPGEPSRVELELTVGEHRYRVVRTPAYERPKLRGQGTVWAQPTAQLDQLVAGQWECLESQVRNVETRIAEIVRLARDQFQQVVLLAQGQFQEFLVADSDQRRDLLRKLFGTGRFTEYSRALDDRARELTHELTQHRVALGERVAALGKDAAVHESEWPAAEPGDRLREWVAGLVAEQDAVLRSAKERESELALMSQQADVEHQRVSQQGDAQRRRDEARLRKASLEAEADEITSLREKLLSARKADLAKPAIDGWTTAKSELDDRLGDRKQAEDAYLSVWPDLPADRGAIDAQVDALTRLDGALAPALSEEQHFDELVARVDAARLAVAAFDKQREELGGIRDRLRAELDEAELSLNELDAAAVRLPAAEALEGNLQVQLVAARYAEQLSAEVAQARERSLAAGQMLTSASAARDDLRRRQLEGFAGELGHALVPGDACPVCGSTEHPSPASPGPDHVGEQAVEEAERLVAGAIEASRVADAEVTRLDERLADQAQRAGGSAVSELEPLFAQAEEQVRELRQRAQQASETRQRVAELRKQIDQRSAELELGQSEREQLVTSHSVAAKERDDVSARLELARDGFETVESRLVDVRSRLALCRRLRDATSGAREASAREAEEASRLATAIADAGFASAVDAEAALLPALEQQIIEKRVTTHATTLGATEQLLAAPDLQGLPEEPVDVEAALAVKTKSAADLKEAVGVRSVAEPKLTRMRQAQDGITSLARRLSQVQEQHEVVDRLARTVRGQEPNTMKMQLEAFVLAAELEEIVRAANTRLRDMTSGRYELHHSDAKAARGRQSGLALSVMDAHTGENRSPESLSGGEKFQASLALALGLAEVVTNRAGGMRLDTLFIDEGFGSLDSDTLETTMATLDSLREGGRTVGLISHVESMKESIPAQLKVKRVAGGWSVIERG